MRESEVDPTPAPPSAGAVHAATLFCDVCAAETAHRIVRIDTPAGKGVSGLARCRECRTTHRFETPVRTQHVLSEILSDGPESERRVRSLSADEQLTVGERMPDRTPPAVIHKLDRLDGRSVRSAPARDIRTAWLTRDDGAVVKVSLVDGRRTSAARVTLPPDTRLVVGAILTVDGRSWHISGMRANGRTWRHPDDNFPAREVQRVYARRYARPPAGNND
ncbi:MAG: HVO_0476 family zinc finger protein [Candidatus Lutacidiplasmatales archaeon]